MRYHTAFMTGLCGLFAASTIAAETAVPLTAPMGEVTRVEGKVYLHEGDGVRGKRIRAADTELTVGHTLRTKRESRAFVSFIDESQVILQEQSLLTIEGLKQIKTGEGKVLFSIKPQGGAQGLRITTRSAIIGVKGTQFLLDIGDDSLNVYLKEGNLNIDSPEGDFARYRKRSREEFESYRKQQREGFEEYKKQQEDEFLEYVRSITMATNSAISIDGKEMRDITIPAEIIEEFELFEVFNQGSQRPAHQELEQIDQTAVTEKSEAPQPTGTHTPPGPGMAPNHQNTAERNGDKIQQMTDEIEQELESTSPLERDLRQ